MCDRGHEVILGVGMLLLACPELFEIELRNIFSKVRGRVRCKIPQALSPQERNHQLGQIVQDDWR